MTSPNYDEGGSRTSLLGTKNIDTMEPQTSIRMPDTFMTPPLVCLFSAASARPSISTGKERDAESGNDYFGARYYASSMGRWMSPDPSGLFFADPENPQSMNLYAYVSNNPVNSIDTDGRLTIVIPGTWWKANDWNYNTALVGEATSHFHEQHQTWLDEWDPRGNSSEDRATAARGLADFINNYNFAPGEQLNIVTHSHGGNVALQAAALGLKHQIDVLITLGAPFGYGSMNSGIKDWYNITGSGDYVQTNASVGCWNCDIQQGAHNYTVQSGGHSTLWNNKNVRDLWWNWFTNQQQQSQPSQPKQQKEREWDCRKDGHDDC